MKLVFYILQVAGVIILVSLVVALTIGMVFIQPIMRLNYNEVVLQSNQQVTIYRPSCATVTMTFRVLATEKNIALVQIDGTQQEATVFQPLRYGTCEIAFVDTITRDGLKLWTPKDAVRSPVAN